MSWYTKKVWRTSVALPKILVASEVENLEQFHSVIQKILYCGAELTFQSELHLSVKNPTCEKNFPSSNHPVNSCLTLTSWVKPDLWIGWNLPETQAVLKITADRSRRHRLACYLDLSQWKIATAWGRLWLYVCNSQWLVLSLTQKPLQLERTSLCLTVSDAPSLVGRVGSGSSDIIQSIEKTS